MLNKKSPMGTFIFLTRHTITYYVGYDKFMVEPLLFKNAGRETIASSGRRMWSN